MPEIYLPVLHPGQIDIWRQRTRLNAVRCGRRWGKTKMMVTLAGDTSAKGGKVGLFTPEHKQTLEPYDELKEILSPIIRRASRNEGIIRTWTGGLIDFWATDDNELAGRGREYDLVEVDEAAFTKNKTMYPNIWRKSIKPTMLTRRGVAWVFSTPNGVDPENFFWKICNDPEAGFKEFHAPTNTNPYVPEDEFEKERLSNHPLVFEQEYLAEFRDFRGVAFFDITKCLDDGQPVPYPQHCDYVFAVVDTAVKTGKKNDGTAVCYFAKNSIGGHPLILLDWDIVQIEGSLLEAWLPTVFQNLEDLARKTGARAGSVGTWIEDKATGSVLCQQAARRGWPARAIDSVLTSLGKDERAISVSGYVYRGMFKISDHAHSKVTIYKETSRNHFAHQFFGYLVGVENQADDLLDCGCYGIAIALGNAEGY